VFLYDVGVFIILSIIIIICRFYIQFRAFFCAFLWVALCFQFLVDNDIELTTKYNKPAKNGRQYPMDKLKIKNEPYFDTEFKDRCAQMFLGNVQTMKMGIIEGADKYNARVISIDNWTFDEVKSKAFKQSVEWSNVLDKISTILAWIKDKVTSQADDVEATLEFSNATQLFTLITNVKPSSATVVTTDDVELEVTLARMSLKESTSSTGKTENKV